MSDYISTLLGEVAARRVLDVTDGSSDTHENPEASMSETVNTFRLEVEALVQDEDREDWFSTPDYLVAQAEAAIVMLKADVANVTNKDRIREHAVELGAAAMRLAYCYGDL